MMTVNQRRHSAFTLIECLAVIFILLILFAFFLPFTRGSREAARRMSCSGHFKQIGLSIHNYHSAYKCLPPGIGGTIANQRRLSGLVFLTPFLEQQALWEQISSPSTMAGINYPSMGPSPLDGDYEPWRTSIATYQCPSEPNEPDTFGTTNYVFSLGDTARAIQEQNPSRGMFGRQDSYRFRDILDGLSNTIAMAEVRRSTDRLVSGSYAVMQSPSLLDDISFCSQQLVGEDNANFFADTVPLGNHARGGVWADGAAAHGMFNTILPPNSPSCMTGTAMSNGIVSAGSNHHGGCHVLMADGAVIFMTNSIESGNPQAATAFAIADQTSPLPPSPHGLWGALGSATSQEEIEEQLNQ